MSTWQPSARELERRAVRRSRRTVSVLIATLATLVVFGLIGIGLVSSPGWERVQDLFFNPDEARAAFGPVLDGIWVNIRLFLICQPIIMVVAMLLALARTSRSPWLVPARVFATLYTDVVRGIPTLLLVTLFAFGIPALGLQGVTSDELVWAGVALVVSYSAYVAEVFRAGIDSIHPSQLNSASALGLSRGQTMRFVVVPQAVKRVVPPLLNDFVSLQKDTALVSAAGVADALLEARNIGLYNFNYTGLVVVACFFVVMTVPLARYCDWLQRRWLERERAGAL